MPFLQIQVGEAYWSIRKVFRRIFAACIVALFVFPGAKVWADQEAKAGKSTAKAGDTKPAPGPVKQGGKLKDMISGGGEQGQLPVYIKSDTLTLNSKDRVFTYKGNVEIVRGDITITADTVIGKYDDKNQLQKVIGEDNVVLTRGEDLRANANRAVYSIPLATIELTEGPELARKGNLLSADKITVYVNEDRSEAEGNVRVKVIQTENASAIGAAKDKVMKGDREKEGAEAGKEP
jgi:lipopolysaccharide export system protein LptA